MALTWGHPAKQDICSMPVMQAGMFQFYVDHHNE
jgi:hypothetical protein